MLDAEQVARFHLRGHVTIPRLVASDEVAWIEQVLERLLAARLANRDGRHLDLAGANAPDEPVRIPQLMAPHQDAPELLGARFLADASEIGRDLLGPEAVTTIAMAIIKPPGATAETPWHQDAAYWEPDRIHTAASIWIPLRDATPDSGCLQLAPGSHRLDVLPHRHLGGDERIHALELVPEVADGAIRTVVDAPVPAGGASIHHGYLLHRAGGNLSDRPRPALILSVRNPAADVPRARPLAFAWQG